MRDYEVLESQLETQLASLQILDKTSIIAGVGTVQGATQQNSSAQLSVLNSAPTAASGAAASPGTGSTSLSLDASSRLQEELALQMEINELQMLLHPNPSLNDYQFLGGNYEGSPVRLVAEFDVTLDPSGDYDWDYANVEVAITPVPPDGASKKNSALPSDLEISEPNQVTLLALMPEQHSVNVVNGKTNTDSFGIGPIASFAQLGFTVGGGQSSQFVSTDYDIIAYPEQEPKCLCKRPFNDGTLTLLWQFRPTLGRRRLSPGTRHVFAVLQLPNAEPEEATCEFRTASFWRTGSKQMAGDIIASSRNFEPGSRVFYPGSNNIETLTASKLAERVSIHDLGGGLLLATGQGFNLTPDCSIALGGKIYRNDGVNLTINPDGRYTLLFPAVGLISKDPPTLIDTHGTATDIPFEPQVETETSQKVISFDDPAAVAIDGSNTELTFTLTPPPGGDNTKFDGILRPLIGIAGKLYGLSDNPFSSYVVVRESLPGTSPSTTPQIKIKVVVPTTALSQANLFYVIDPFKGRPFIATRTWIPKTASYFSVSPSATFLSQKTVKSAGNSVNYYSYLISGTALGKVTSVLFGAGSNIPLKQGSVHTSIPGIDVNRLDDSSIMVTVCDTAFSNSAGVVLRAQWGDISRSFVVTLPAVAAPAASAAPAPASGAAPATTAAGAAATPVAPAVAPH